VPGPRPNRSVRHAVYVARSPRSTRVDGAHTAPADLLITDPAFRSQQAAAEGDPFAAIDESDSVESSDRASGSCLSSAASTASSSPPPPT